MDNAPILHPERVGLTEGDVEEVQARRASLRRASAEVREALRAPEEGAPVTAGVVLGAVRRLGQVWTAHTADTERPDGVLAQIVGDCPRLSPAVDRLQREHGHVADALRAVERLLDAPRAAEPVDQVTAMPALLALLGAVERHRRDGRNLIYDAYNVDLGLGE